MIEVICLDDKNKPSIIPQEKWIKEGEKYTISHIYRMANPQQKGLQGCSVKEINLDDEKYLPYNCFKMTRFGFKVEDLPALIELIELCTSLDEVDIKREIEELTLIPEEL